LLIASLVSTFAIIPKSGFPMLDHALCNFLISSEECINESPAAVALFTIKSKLPMSLDVNAGKFKFESGKFNPSQA